eukprot:GHVO01013942.1.p2 GENE.GHVO01013942.1~~GHVO01013942.1.p2  ORF type:complete len:104 (-),score=12.57 GHVO01013942.1:207-518(-)
MDCHLCQPLQDSTAIFVSIHPPCPPCRRLFQQISSFPIFALRGYPIPKSCVYNTVIIKWWYHTPPHTLSYSPHTLSCCPHTHCLITRPYNGGGNGVYNTVIIS